MNYLNQVLLLSNKTTEYLDPGGWIPFVGHVGLIMKAPHGAKRSWKNIVELKKKFVPPGVELMRLNIPVLNPGKGEKKYQMYRVDLKY